MSKAEHTLTKELDSEDFNNVQSGKVKRKWKLLNEAKTGCDDERCPPDVVVKYKILIVDVDEGDKLGDEHINAANQLLQSQFSDIQGLQSFLLGQRFCFTKFNVVKGYAGCSYIQVMHTGEDHWVTIEIIGEDKVRVLHSIFLTNILRIEASCICHGILLLES